MLEKDAKGWRCDECGCRRKDLHTMHKCPDCEVPLQTDVTKAQRASIAANERFQRLVAAAMQEKRDVQVSITVKVVRGHLSSIRVITHDDYPLDSEQIEQLTNVH